MGFNKGTWISEGTEMRKSKISTSLVDAEIKETLVWLCEETERTALQLEADGSKVGLDSNQGAYTQIHEEFARRMKAIGEKYGLLQKEK